MASDSSANSSSGSGVNSGYNGTTLVAERTDTGQRLAIGDTDPSLLRTLSDARLLRCVHCGGLLTLKAGAVRLHHFAHVNRAACENPDHEPETESHRLGKFALYRHFRQNSQEAALEYRITATDQRADCFIRASDGRPYALEFQQANNSVNRWNERHSLYHSAGLSDLWFLGIIRYRESAGGAPGPISAYDPLPVPHQGFEAASGTFHVRELEKAIVAAEHELVYLDPETEMLTLLLARSLSGNTVRAYRYRLALASAELRSGRLWTPLDPFLEDYRRAFKA